MQSRLGKMLNYIPAYPIIFYISTFLQTFIKGFQIWFRGKNYSISTDRVY